MAKTHEVKICSAFKTRSTRCEFVQCTPTLGKWPPQQINIVQVHSPQKAMEQLLQLVKKRNLVIACKIQQQNYTETNPILISVLQILLRCCAR